MTSHPTPRQLIAITGGIGSGKSHVCRRLAARGIRVYDCDEAAKRLLATCEPLQEAVRRLVGTEVYVGGKLQKPVLVRFLLASQHNKEMVNDTIHPYVAADFMDSGMQWLESAILFESGFHRRVPFTFVVCVSAPDDVRLARIMARDHIPADKAADWIRCQMPQQDMERRSDWVIRNDGDDKSLGQEIDRLLAHLSRL